jgi:transketolase
MADSTPTPVIKTVPKPRDQHLRDMADCIRFLSMDAVQQANSGYPGAPLGMADIATVLFRDFVQFDAVDPHWFDRDRFVLSNGHASMLLYSLLYLTGVKDMTLDALDELKRFRQIAGHPEYKHADGIETTTGPLGKALQTRWASPSPSAS